MFFSNFDVMSSTPVADESLILSIRDKMPDGKGVIGDIVLSKFAWGIENGSSNS